jgi:hypothetical protein
VNGKWKLRLVDRIMGFRFTIHDSPFTQIGDEG